MTIGNTHTHIDLPYRCKRCGKSVRIEDRYRWKHNCIPTEKNYFGNVSKERRMPSYKTVKRKPVEERYSPSYKHGHANLSLWQRIKRFFRR